MILKFISDLKKISYLKKLRSQKKLRFEKNLRSHKNSQKNADSYLKKISDSKKNLRFEKNLRSNKKLKKCRSLKKRQKFGRIWIGNRVGFIGWMVGWLVGTYFFEYTPDRRGPKTLASYTWKPFSARNFSAMLYRCAYTHNLSKFCPILHKGSSIWYFLIGKLVPRNLTKLRVILSTDFFCKM